MSYNPNRPQILGKPVRRMPEPGDGIRHSDIMRRRGLGTSLEAVNRVETPYGLSSELCKCKNFSVCTNVIGAGNNLGTGVNEKQTKFVFVLKGVLWATVYEKDKEPVRHMYQSGGVFIATPGTTYCLASSGTMEAEVLVVADTGYEKNFKLTEEPSFRVLDTSMMITPTTGEVRARTDGTMAKAQALEMAGQVAQAKIAAKNVAQTNANSANIRSVNLPPIMPTDD